MSEQITEDMGLHQQWYEAQVEACNLDATASRLEKMEKVIFETIKLDFLDTAPVKITVSRAEAEARTATKYVDHLTSMFAAREVANLAKAKADAIKMMHWDQQSSAATERAVARM